MRIMQFCNLLEDCKGYPSFGVLAVHYVEQNRIMLRDIFDMLRTVYNPTAVQDDP